MVERLSYALIAGLFGMLIGVACWWLHGLAHSANFSGSGIDPVLRHWVIYCGAVFALIGFVLREAVADVAGDTLNAILHFELDRGSGSNVSWVFALVFLAIVIATIWHTVPS